jgi:tubulin alpha
METVKPSEQRGNRSVITVHAGQCGIQCATSIWRLMMSEHSVNKEGFVVDSAKNEMNTVATCFRETSAGLYLPRAIFVDLEPNVIDSVTSSDLKNTFARVDMICEYEDAANCYARGRYVCGLNAIYEARQRLRCNIEATDHCVAVVSNASTSGGTGSGLLPDIITIDEGSRSYSSIGLKVYPSRSHDNTLAYYNTCLHTNAMNDLIDFNILLDNDALGKVAQNSLMALREPKNQISFKQLNDQIAQIFSGLTVGERKLDSSGMSIHRFQTCLVPYPGLIQVGVTLACYHEPADRNQTLRTLVKDAFGKFTSCTIDRRSGAYMSSFMLFRGVGRGCTVRRVISTFDFTSFVPWVPTRYSLASSAETPRLQEDDSYKMPPETIMHMWNHTAMGDVLAQYSAWIGVSYTKKSFLHWYMDNGMQASELEDAMQSLELLKKVYQSIGESK